MVLADLFNREPVIVDVNLMLQHFRPAMLCGLCENFYSGHLITPLCFNYPKAIPFAAPEITANGSEYLVPNPDADHE